MTGHQAGQIGARGTDQGGDLMNQPKRAGNSLIHQQIDAGDPVHLIIYDLLEHDWCARVQRQVDDRILMTATTPTAAPIMRSRCGGR